MAFVAISAHLLPHSSSHTHPDLNDLEKTQISSIPSKQKGLQVFTPFFLICKASLSIHDQNKGHADANIRIVKSNDWNEGEKMAFNWHQS